MKLTPNIDQSGRKMRMRGGILACVVGVVLTVWGAVSGSRGMLIAGIFLIVTGAFMIFEASHGWCALRAMGLKTKM